MARSRNWEEDDTSDDDLPSLEAIMHRCKPQAKPKGKATSQSQPVFPTERPKDDKDSKDSTMRRRKLGQASDNTLLRPLGQSQETRSLSDKPVKAVSPDLEEENVISRGPRVELRARKPKPSPAPDENSWDHEEGETVVEEVTIVDDSVYFSFSDQDSEEEDEDEDYHDDFEDSLEDFLRKKRPSPTKSRTEPLPSCSQNSLPRKKLGLKSASLADLDKGLSLGTVTTAGRSNAPKGTQRKASGDRGIPFKDVKSEKPACLEDDIAGPFSKLRIDSTHAPSGTQGKSPPNSRLSTPSPQTPPKSRPNTLKSPTKRFPRIPMTPHGPSTDEFWSQELTDDWNEQHSPRKLFAPAPPPPPESPSQSPSKQSKNQNSTTSPTKKTKKQAAAEAAKQREAKKSFEAAKHEMAADFLRELDDVITSGKLGSLAASTGGIRIQWTSKLNTTAGRANWRRETVRTTHHRIAGAGVEDPPSSSFSITHRHHAAIDLAEKVIDNPSKLLNVIAHEFCHLANFMISDVTTNPHGREFKAWASRVSGAFADRGIEVTTKHSYDIDFKYVWECVECALEYKRHSRSVNTSRHRCGACKGELRQTKPVPRATAAGADGTTQKRPPSEYQLFMKEQMKVIREENPGSPQKEVMKQVAERWAKKTVKTPKLPTLPKPPKTQQQQGSKGSGAVDDEIGRIVDAAGVLSLDD